VERPSGLIQAILTCARRCAGKVSSCWRNMIRRCRRRTMDCSGACTRKPASVPTANWPSPATARRGRAGAMAAASAKGAKPGFFVRNIVPAPTLKRSTPVQRYPKSASDRVPLGCEGRAFPFTIFTLQQPEKCPSQPCRRLRARRQAARERQTSLRRHPLWCSA